MAHLELERLGCDYQLQFITYNELKSSAFFKINPMAQVPVLVDGEVIVTQNIAIWHYLNNKFFSTKLKSANDLNIQIEVLRWLSFLNSDVHPNFYALFDEMAYLGVKNSHQAKSYAITHLQKLFSVISKQLNDKNWLAGAKSPTIADSYAFVLLRWACALHLNLNWLDNLQLDLSHIPNLADFMQRFGAVKSVKKVMYQEGLIY